MLSDLKFERPSSPLGHAKPSLPEPEFVLPVLEGAAEDEEAEEDRTDESEPDAGASVGEALVSAVDEGAAVAEPVLVRHVEEAPS